mmetsp:Transcript_47335/g.111618  ORF Transcript_47335/g.111618 Transcript_47335/m.111618 type:complete len:279 (+) Transcript_47335:128-964(+)
MADSSPWRKVGREAVCLRTNIACARKGSLRSPRPDSPFASLAKRKSTALGSFAASGLARASGVSSDISRRSHAGAMMPTRISSSTHDRRIWYLALAEGRPMYCLMSARSTKARSIASVMLEVVMTITLRFSLSWSIWVRRALTTRMASEGSLPLRADLRAAVSDSTSSMRTTTKVSSSSTRSLIESNSLFTSFPLSLNHLEKSECAFTSTNCPNLYRSDRRIDSLCARALQSDVLPVPGGPCRSTTLFQAMMFASTRLSAKYIADSAYSSRWLFTSES